MVPPNPSQLGLMRWVMVLSLSEILPQAGLCRLVGLQECEGVVQPEPQAVCRYLGF